LEKRPARQQRAVTPRRLGTPTPRKALSVAALLFAGALVVGMSVPTNLFIDTSSTASASAVSAGGAPARLAGQSLDVSQDAVSAAPTRDGFQVMSYAQTLKLKYGNSAANYTVTTGAVRWPFPYAVGITDGFGPRYLCDGCSNFHKGVDFVPGAGAPIYAIADGVVIQALEDTASGYGNHVMIQHMINGQPVESLYAHMLSDSRAVNVGDVVKVGDFLGLVGNTGTSFGAHLHLEIHLNKVPVDPFAWLLANTVN
jgi:murein DD-endopeptidase MepM/ murein hydrolase activator NlpD